MILILGSGEIARYLARLAALAGFSVQVAEADVADHDWPAGVETRAAVYTDVPWPLPAGTHAVVARGHQGDPESVRCLLEQGAERVYLIASARRADNVIEAVRQNLSDPALLARLSAPAGIDLGGNGSAQIALSILAEMQWRMAGEQGELRPMTERRQARLDKTRSGQRFESCPGQRK